MNNLFAVLKATFINDWSLNGFSKDLTSTKEKRKILVQVLTLLIGAVAIAITVTMYAILMADSLEQVGYLQLIVVMGIGFSTLMTFFTSIYKAQGSLFAAKDYDLLMSLPIKSSVILTSKIINLLVLNWVFVAFVMIPPTTIYYTRTEGLSWVYFILVIISIIFIPLIPVIIASVFAVIISYFASKFKYKNLTTIVGTMILLVLILLGSFNMENIIQYVFNNSASIIDAIGNIYPPIAYLTNALIDINIIEYLKFILISVIPFIVFILLFSKVFKKINCRLGETYKKANYKVGALKTNRPVKALVDKEIKRYLSTPVYIMNTAVGMIMVLMAAIATMFIDAKTLSMYMEIPYVQDIFPLIALLTLIFGIGLASTTPSSISLEGKNLWILKSLPIREREIFISKIMLSLIVTLPATLIINIIFFIGLRFTLIDLIWNLAISIVFCFFGAIVGLVVNLNFPKLEWSSPTVVVKQSAAVLITILITMLAIGLPIAIFIVFKVTNINLFLGICLMILVFITSILWKILNNNCVKKFQKL